MNIEQKIKELVEAVGSHYVHLIDGYELNAMMPKLARQYCDFTVNYVSEGGGFSVNTQGQLIEAARLQMMWCGVVPFDKDATKEADAVQCIIDKKKETLRAFVAELYNSGYFQPVESWSYSVVPIRFDAVCACLIANIEVRTTGECM